MIRFLLLASLSLAVASRLAAAPPETLNEALLDDRAPEVEQYLKNGGDPDAMIEDATLLTIAANNGSMECIEVLLKHQADINKPSQDGDTALLRTARHLYRTGIEPLQYLVEHGAKVNQTFPKGTSALMCVASPAGSQYDDLYLEAVNLLIARGADVNAKNEMGATPLSLATEAKAKKIVAALKKAGARK